jgi:hypothetical protein
MGNQPPADLDVFLPFDVGWVEGGETFVNVQARFQVG